MEKSDPEIQAVFYLSPTLDALWRWSADGDTLAWAEGKTIAFWPEVETVLRRLAPRGLPPFGAVALMLGACRDSWPASHGRETIVGYTKLFRGFRSSGAGTVAPPAAGPQLMFGWVANDIDRLLEGLDAIHELPAELRENLAAKAVLAEMIFETAKDRSTPEKAEAIIEAMSRGISPAMLRPQLCHEEALAQFARQVDGMHAGLARIDPDSLERRIRTGLEQQVRPAEEELAPPERVRRLLAELKNDPELAGIARLAQNLMAAVSVPRSLRLREELAVGGVSDLSNRGPLDRLLVSELAHDDLTLAVRIALNEALYLRRESPPREPPHRRAILIDTGIRMWGVPRVFAAAVAMAFAATNDPRAELFAFRPAGERVESVDLMSRRGVDALLASLETSPHPGAALAPFFERLSTQGHTDEPTDAVLITHPDVFSDRAFFAAASATIPKTATTTYVVTVDRAGAFRMISLARAGTSVIREATISLDAILAPPPPIAVSSRGASSTVPLISSNNDGSKPAILYTTPFPFLLTHQSQPAMAAVSAQHGLVAATEDGRLLHWRDDAHGARQITSLLPKGKVRFVHVEESTGNVLLLIARVKGGELDLVSVDLLTASAGVTRLPTTDANLKGAFLVSGYVCAIYDGRFDAFDPLSGALIGSVDLSTDAKWTRGRFFQTNLWWSAAAFRDGKPTLEPIRFADDWAAIQMFDRVDGPVALMNDGRVIDTVGREICRTSPDRQAAKFVGVSGDGNRLLFERERRSYLLDLNKPADPMTTAPGEPWVALDSQAKWSTQPWHHARVKLRGVFVDDLGRLCLERRAGGGGWFTVDAYGRLVFAEAAGALPWPAHRQRGAVFEDVRRTTCARWMMRIARWNDGSRAWLDGRGMLHLKSSDPVVPELSIVLSSSSPAAWSSDGKVCGPAYHVGDDVEQTDARYFINIIDRFLVRLR